ncbi:N-acetylmuramoyl-L-alanine amidase [Pokkaliibacter sp. CJK22405]|uniref:N-acetylmuramoyl-L-alanine amidase family protein n=1 Tax=Pokkaliibacter sp. CJK22405 TaxID=3384615 RepID=UPI003984A010
MMTRILQRLILLLCCTFLSVSAFGATINGVRLWQAPDNTRLVFDLSAPIQYQAFMVENPDRLVIDVDNSTFNASLSGLALQGSPIKEIRTGVRQGNNLRIVMDLSQRLGFKHFTLAPNATYGNRLVVDIQTPQSADKAIPVPATPTPVKSSSDPLPAAPTTPAPQAVQAPEYRNIIIAVDAGHGGEDPGAIGAGGLREKNVVLAIARKLEALLAQEPGFTPYLTRRGDYFIELRKRTLLARDANADMFVSIHADAFKNTSARGASVWTLSERGATSEMGRWLAQQENSSDLIGGVGNVSLDDKDEVLAGVLLDLSMTSTLKMSDNLGKDVLKHVGGFAKLHKNHVERAGFVVLKSPDIPSILVETGFISNPTEANNLKSSQYQQRMAEAIFRGIKQHFYEQPQPNTWIAAKIKNPGLPPPSGTGTGASAGNRLYRVISGDTLSAIAAKNGISLRRLLDENQLTLRSTIKVGQKLVIPNS